MHAQSRLAKLQNDAPRSYSLQQQAEKIFVAINAQSWGEQVHRRMDEIGG